MERNQFLVPLSTLCLEPFIIQTSDKTKSVSSKAQPVPVAVWQGQLIGIGLLAEQPRNLSSPCPTHWWVFQRQQSVRVLTLPVLISDIFCLLVCLPFFLLPSPSVFLSSFFSFLFRLRPAITFSVTCAENACGWVTGTGAGIGHEWPAKSDTNPRLEHNGCCNSLSRGRVCPIPTPPVGCDGSAAQTESCFQRGAKREVVSVCVLWVKDSAVQNVYFSGTFSPDKV